MREKVAATAGVALRQVKRNGGDPETCCMKEAKPGGCRMVYIPSEKHDSRGGGDVGWCVTSTSSCLAIFCNLLYMLIHALYST